jgi:hypothetical protein
MTTQEPFIPPAQPSTTTSSTTSSTTACSATVVANAMTSLEAYKGVGIGIPAFTFYLTAGNKAKVRATGFQIKDLPAAGDGILYLNNVAVTDEQVISVEDNGKLIYIPKADADASATFNFLVQTNCGNSANAAVTIAVTDKPVDEDCDCGTTSSTTTTT